MSEEELTDYPQWDVKDTFSYIISMLIPVVLVVGSISLICGVSNTEVFPVCLAAYAWSYGD